MTVLADLSAHRPHRIRRAGKEQNRAIGALGCAAKTPGGRRAESAIRTLILWNASRAA